MLLVLSVIAVAAGTILAWLMYVSTPVRPERMGGARTPLHAFLLNAYYIDWLYDRALVRPLLALFTALWRIFDVQVVDGLVNLAGLAVVAWSGVIRRLQTGYVVNYALTMLVGAVAVLGFLLFR
jgi:NADH-quinone oxidoreductase subunit L